MSRYIKTLRNSLRSGLYQFNRLSFRVMSAPGIYQRCMDNLFAREPDVMSYQNDILIIGRWTSRQLRILKKLSASSFRVRLDKCKFMAPSVTYLGHQIDPEGLHPTEDKIRAIRDAPPPRNVTELKTFLKLFQFYSRYVPNVADKLGLLYRLLQNGVSWGVENRSLFSVSTSEWVITDESCPGPLWSQEGTYPHLWC